MTEVESNPSLSHCAVEVHPRLRRPDRDQVRLEPMVLDELIPPDHEAQTMWAVVERLSLSGFYAPIRARGSVPGRCSTEPK